ncbi:MAG TPA: sigma-70 family RNA polymerase sigma factor [Vicinamibacterales bacterium]|nr:sigma-70 family RNA polymerase sigma factor [Vicinamibacterales bacterium]
MVITGSGRGAAGAPSALLAPEEQRALVERIRAGDVSAEETLVRIFRDRVAFFAIARTRDPEAARDLTQDVMLAVVRALRSGQLRDADRLGGFVHGTARNLINGYLRDRSRLKEDPIDAALSVTGTSEAADNDRERATLVRRALGALSSIDRKILWLTLVEGLKPGEIAARLGLTSEAVRTRKSRAVKKTTQRIKFLSRT